MARVKIRRPYLLLLLDFGAVQKEWGSPIYFKFTSEFKSAKI